MFYIDPIEFEFDAALTIMKILKSGQNNHEIKEGDRDQCRVVLHSFLVFFSDQIKHQIERIINETKNSFCVMAPAAGPYYIDPKAEIEIRTWLPSCFEVIIGKEYVGHIYLTNNKCGIDNLNVIIKNFQ